MILKFKGKEYNTEYFSDINDNWFLDLDSIYLNLKSYDKIKNHINGNHLYISIKELYDLVGLDIMFKPAYIPNNIYSFETQYLWYYKNLNKK